MAHFGEHNVNDYWLLKIAHIIKKKTATTTTATTRYRNVFVDCEIQMRKCPFYFIAHAYCLAPNLSSHFRDAELVLFKRRRRI